MKNKALLIVPTRGRNQKHLELYNSFKETASPNIDLCFALDDDDLANYQIIQDERVFYEINPRMRMLPTLNLVATKYANDYEYIAFMGDDHRPRTLYWDEKFVKEIETSGTHFGICYGDDLIQHEAMCTAVFMSSNIIRTLGYMHPTNLIHLVADIFWKELGQTLGILHYCPEIIIEHMHFTVGKADRDELYAEVNAGSMYEQDGRAYGEYKETRFESDLSKLRDAIHIGK